MLKHHTVSKPYSTYSETRPTFRFNTTIYVVLRS